MFDFLNSLLTESFDDEISFFGQPRVLKGHLPFLNGEVTFDIVTRDARNNVTKKQFNGIERLIIRSITVNGMALQDIDLELDHNYFYYDNGSLEQEIVEALVEAARVRFDDNERLPFNQKILPHVKEIAASIAKVLRESFKETIQDIND
jgi:hypothetical protein